MSTGIDQITNIVNNVTAPWPSFTGVEQECFQIFQTQLQSQYGITLWQDVLQMELGYIQSIEENPAIPHPDATAWATVASTLASIAGMKDGLRDYFSGQATYFVDFKIRNSDLIRQVSGYVALAQQTTVSFPLGAVVNVALDPLNFIPELAPFVGLARDLFGFLLGALNPGVDPYQVALQNEMGQLENSLTTEFNNLNNTATQTLNTVLNDYGKMSALIKLLNTTVWPQQENLFSPQALLAAEIEIWKAFLPVRWPICRGWDYVRDDEGSFEASLYSCSPECYVFNFVNVTLPMSHETMIQANVGVLAEDVNDRLAPSSAQRLFGTLGVQRSDVFTGSNGWPYLQDGSDFPEEGPGYIYKNFINC